MSHHIRRVLHLLIGLAIGAGCILLAHAVYPATEPSAQQQLEAARKRLETSGSFRFDVEIDQLLLPRGVPEMIGAGDERSQMQAMGETVLPDQSVLTLKPAGYGIDPLTVVQAGDQVLLSYQGEVRPLEQHDSLPLPSLDFLGYLDAAINVERVERAPATAAPPTHPQYYRFDIDGTILRDHLHQQMERQIGAALPPGAQVAPPPGIADLSGHGEAWLDADGMLVRQRLHLNLPRVSDGYHAEVKLDIHFRDAGQVASILQPIPTADGGWTLELQPADPGTVAAATFWQGVPEPLVAAARWLLLILLTGGALVWLLRIYIRYPRHSYVIVALSLIAMIVLTPLLQQASIVRVGTRVAAAAERQHTEQHIAEELHSYAADKPLVRAALEQAGLAPTQPQLQQNPPEPIVVETCGDGQATSDVDGDGLSDLAEGCLGTDAYSVDTDFDQLTDTLEIDGLLFNGTRYTLDPFKVDTNGDGLNDSHEWLAPAGTAPAWDPDGDNVPNPWDSDNDNDGVSDGYDISPFTASDVRESFALETSTQNGFDGYQYIDIQIRPADPERLRYTNATFDWPNNDNAGQITDLNDSTEDLSLVPLLEISTNNPPDLATAETYGVSIFEGEGVTKLYAPLYTVVDNGLVTSFQTRVAYAPAQLGTISWTDVRLVWAVTAELDQYTACTDSNGTNCVRSSRELVQVYPDQLQVVGIQITKSGSYEMALFGTPDNANDDAVLLQLVTSLAVTFLAAEQLSDQPPGISLLEDLATRFNSPNTPVEQKFAIDETVTAVRQTYAHQDAGIADITQQQVRDFLNQPAYLGTTCTTRDGSSFPCASLILATEERQGYLSLDEFGGTTPDFAALSVNLDDDNFPMIRTRGLRINPYAYRGGEWTALDVGQLLDVIDQRYNYQELAVEPSLQEDLPGITADDLAYVTTVMYLNWVTGQRELAGIDAASLLAANPDAKLTNSVFKTIRTATTKAPEQAIKLLFNNYLSARPIQRVAEGPDGTDVFIRKQLTSEVRNFRDRLNDYRKVVTNSNLDDLDDIVDIEANRITNRAAVRSARSALARTTLIGIGRAAYIGGSIVVVAGTITQIACTASGDEACAANAKIATQVGTGIVLVGSLTERTVGVIDKVAKGSSLLDDTAGKAKFFSKFTTQSKVVRGLLIAGLVLEIAAVWTVFGITAANSDNSYGWRVALAYAVVATVFAVVLFLISLIPGGDIIVAIFAIIDFIVTLATGKSIVQYVAEFFYNVKILTVPRGFSFVGGSTRTERGTNSIVDGTVIGNVFAYSDTLVTTFGRTDDGSRDDLLASRSRLRFAANGSTSGASPIFSSLRDECVIIDQEDRASQCSSTQQAAFYLVQPRQNLNLSFAWSIEYNYRYREESLAGLIKVGQDETINLPDDEDDPADYVIDFTIDVLPDTPTGLWNWSVPDNPDTDGDGVLNADEPANGTQPDNPDTDGDGLDDGFELDNRDTIGANPLLADTDGDGLDDKQELRLGIGINDPDSDDDGLTDSVELAGWDVLLPTGRVVRVFSDPLLADADSDGLSDEQERDNGLSPYAINDGARLLLGTTPLASTPEGGRVVMLAPGDPVAVQLDLLSVGQSPVTGTLELCLPASVLQPPQPQAFNRPAGAVPPRTGPTTAACGYLSAWSFTDPTDNTPLALRPGEVISTSFSSRALSVTTSTSGDLIASLPYEDSILTQTLRLTVDVDDPQLAITAPADGSVLRGSSFVVGGTASDPTSWVQQIDLELADSPPITLTGTSPWAYSWALPADGVHTITARARDFVGRTSPAASVQVTVDNTPPTINTTLQNNAYITSIAADGATLTISGSAADNLSGLSRLQISIDGQPWQTIALPATFPTTANWSYPWRLSGADVQGRHTIALRAFDRAGNQSSTIERSVLVDLLPPGNTIGSAAFTAAEPLLVPAGTLTIGGLLNDAARAPLPPVVTPLAGGGTVDTLRDATVWLEFDNPQESANVQITWLGDTDGDGRGDLAVGMPAANGGAGRVAIIPGRYGNWASKPAGELLSASSSFAGASQIGIGAHIAAAGDVDGDGRYDLLVGDPANNRVFLIFGQPDVAGGQDTPLSGGLAGRWTELTTSDPGFLIGRWQAAAGDVNGDGIGDLLIGATGSSGRAYLISGQLAPWPDTINLADEAAAVLPFAPAGAPLQGVGDVNGDTLADFVVADPGNTFGAGAGVYLFAGNAGFAARARVGVATTNALHHFTGASGTFVAALGNVNGDTTTDNRPLTDFIYGDATGATQLVLGRSSGAWSDSRNLGTVPALPDIGGFLAAPGDVNADGFDDLLIGTRDNRAYLVTGRSTIATAALAPTTTLLGAGGAASTPYTAGADLNCDRSSDLLLIPATLQSAGFAEPDLGFGTLPPLELKSLALADEPTSTSPLAVAPVVGSVPSTLLFVDDDYCPTCANDGNLWNVTAFDTIQAAVDAAPSNTQITVQPGIYAGIAISGTAKNDLRVVGVHPDAVFIDGAGGGSGVAITGTQQVQIRNLTIRNVQDAISLTAAGALGYITATNTISLANLLLHSFSRYGLAMDRVSNATVRGTTLAGANGSTAVYVDPTTPDPALASAWRRLADLPLPATQSGVPVAANDAVYALLEDATSHRLHRYDPATTTWTPQATTGLDANTLLSNLVADANGNLYTARTTTGFIPPTDAGSVNVIVRDPDSTDLYIGGTFTAVANPDGTLVEARNIARWDGTTWQPVGKGTQGTVRAITIRNDSTADDGDVYVGGDFLQVVQPDGTTLASARVAQWDVSAGTWLSLGTDISNGRVNGLALFDGFLYAGGTFTAVASDDYLVRRSLTTGVWEAVEDAGTPGYPDGPVSALAVGFSNFGNQVHVAAGNDIDDYAIFLWNGAGWDNTPASGGDNRFNNPVVTLYPAADYQTPANTLVYAGGSINCFNGGCGASGVGGASPVGIFGNRGNTNTNDMRRVETLVNAIAVNTSDPNIVYAAGNITTIDNAVGTPPPANGFGVYDWSAALDPNDASNTGFWLDTPASNLVFPDTLGDDTLRALEYSNGFVYMGGNFDNITANGTPRTNLNSLLRLNTATNQWEPFSGGVQSLPVYFYRYDPVADRWVTLLAPGDLAALASDGGQLLYATERGSTRFWQYNTATEIWAPLPAAPVAAGNGSALAYLGGNTPTPSDDVIYALAGNGDNSFYRYDVAAQTWTQLADFSGSGIIGAGASLVWDGGDYLYATSAGGGGGFARYSLSNTSWESLPNARYDDAGTPTTILFNLGGGLARVDTSLYALERDGNTNFYAYSPVNVAGGPKLIFEDVAFVGRDSSNRWINSTLDSDSGTPTLDPPVDFILSYRATNTWVGDQWDVPLPASSRQISLTDALFLNAGGGLFRVGAGSQLGSGYHDNTNPQMVYVSPTGADGDFTSIRAAIASGANRVMLRAGRYREPFFLVSGVQLAGTSAEGSIIEASPAYSGTLITAEGIAQARLARLAVVGNPNTNGIAIADTAQQVGLSRLIVREAATAIALDGISTTTTLRNLTLVNNADGVVATACAPLDLGNSVLANHSGTAIAYDLCSTALRQYNAYWQNSTNLLIAGTPTVPAGAGEFLADPLFSNPAQHNYRPLPLSPLRGAGAPGTPLPDGSAGTPDIGYFQSGRAAIYVDDDFAPDAPNNGLEWGVDAFSSIQSALDTAQSEVADVVCAGSTADDCDLLTVLVNPGIYTETISVPSKVRLLGSGADQTRLQSSDGSSVITLAGVQQVEVRGFTIAGTATLTGSAAIEVISATRNISLTYNLLRDNWHGVRFGGGASGVLQYATIVNGTGAGVLADGSDTLATVQNSIIFSHTVGLSITRAGSLASRYNLLDNPTNYGGVAAGTGDLQADPQFRDAATSDYRLTPASPAVNAAAPFLAPDPLPTNGDLFTVYNKPPPGGGARADMGYQELLQIPLTLLFGTVGVSCAVGNAGVGSLEVGATRLSNPTLPATATLPTDWFPATFETPQDAQGNPATASFWTGTLNLATAGLYRLYARGSDAAGNRSREREWLVGQFVVDDTAPSVAWATTPPTATTAAAIELIATADDYVIVDGSPRFGVTAISFEVNGTRYPADWDDTGWQVGTPRTFRGWVPLPEGENVIVRAVAIDRAGKIGSRTASVDVSGTDVATIIAPLNGSASPTSTLQVAGYARFGSGATQLVQVRSGGTTLDAVLAQPQANLSAWAVDVTLTGITNTLQADARRSGGFAADDTITVTVDSQLPILAFDPIGTPLRGDVTLTGTVSDTLSGIASVEISLDAGVTWQPAPFNGQQWSFAWSIPEDQQQPAYNVLLRTRDAAGNTRTSSTQVAVDSTPPSGLEPLGFRTSAGIATPGSYIDSFTDLIMQWNPPQDASPIREVAAAIDQNAGTNPAQTLTGTTSFTGSLNQRGAWYAHLAAEDSAGNRLVLNNGPWFVENSTAAVCADRQQFIQLDGRLDTAAGEWRTAREFLDDDERSGQRQELFATWDASDLYIGWRGARWGPDGTLTLYLDTGSGGSTAPLGGQPGTLPFAADYAVNIANATSSTLWRFAGGAWQPDSSTNWAAQVDLLTSGVEVRVPFGATTATPVNRLFALALNTANQPWAIFPTTNPLATAPAWTSAYTWADLCATTNPAVGQPQTRLTNLQAQPQRGSQAIVGPAESLRFEISITNQEQDQPLSGLQLDLNASAGLRYQSIIAGGPACPTGCPANGANWTIPLPDIGTGETLTFAVLAQVISPTTGITSVASTQILRLPALGAFAVLRQQTSTNLLDGKPPQLQVNPTIARRPGLQTISGNATDTTGAGIAVVQISSNGGATWQAAQGTTTWTAQVNVPAADPAPRLQDITVLVRAIDTVGNISDPVALTLATDTTAPTVNFSVPPVITANTLVLSGTASDPDPAGGLLDSIAVQVIDEDNPVQNVSLFTRTGTLYNWFYALDVGGSDGVTIRVRAQATDAAGNTTALSEADWQTALIDNVAPLITTTQQIQQVSLPDYVAGGSGAPVVQGAVSDDNGVAAVQLNLIAPDDSSTSSTATLNGGTWSYTPVLTATGNYRLQVQATDVAGNLRQAVPLTLTVVDGAIIGLRAISSGPTQIGASTTLTATIAGGTGITYTWNLGDGSTASGAVVRHTYGAVGSYTATVTATNSLGSQQASTTIVIVEDIITPTRRIYLPLIVRRQEVGN